VQQSRHVRHFNELAVARMDFEALGRHARRLLEKPTVELELEHYFLVMIFINLPGELRVADEISIPVED